MQDIKIGLSNFRQITNPSERKDEELRKACAEFESIFTHQLLKSMRRTIEKCDLFHGGSGEEIYESMLDQELAKQSSGSGYNSLAHSLFLQLKGNQTSASGEGIEAEQFNVPVKGNQSWVSHSMGGVKQPENQGATPLIF